MVGKIRRDRRRHHQPGSHTMSVIEAEAAGLAIADDEPSQLEYQIVDTPQSRRMLDRLRQTGRVGVPEEESC